MNLLWGRSGDNFRFSINGNFSKAKEVSAAIATSRASRCTSTRDRFPRRIEPRAEGRFMCPRRPPACRRMSPAVPASRALPAPPAPISLRTIAVHVRRRVQLSAVQSDHDAAGARLDIRELRIRREEAVSSTRKCCTADDSGFMIAPLPFDSVADDVAISAQSYYNPLATASAAPRRNPNLTVRMEALGNRQSDRRPIRRWPSSAYAARCSVLNGTTISWSAIAASTRPPRSRGYLYQPGLAGAFGPSFLNADNVVQCGTAANPVPLGQCTPVNIFNLTDPRRSRRSRPSPPATTPIGLHLEAGVVRGGRQDVQHARR